MFEWWSKQSTQQFQSTLSVEQEHHCFFSQRLVLMFLLYVHVYFVVLLKTSVFCRCSPTPTQICVSNPLCGCKIFVFVSVPLLATDFFFAWITQLTPHLAWVPCIKYFLSPWNCCIVFWNVSRRTGNFIYCMVRIVQVEFFIDFAYIFTLLNCIDTYIWSAFWVFSTKKLNIFFEYGQFFKFWFSFMQYFKKSVLPFLLPNSVVISTKKIVNIYIYIYLGFVYAIQKHSF